MNIQPASIRNLYQKSLKDTKPAVKGQPAVAFSHADSKQDTISISADAASRREISEFVSAASAELSRPAGAQRLEQLKAAIENRTYAVSADKVAEAMLSRVI